MKYFIVFIIYILSSSAHAGFAIRCQKKSPVETVTAYITDTGKEAYLQLNSNSTGKNKEFEFSKLNTVDKDDDSYTYNYMREGVTRVGILVSRKGNKIATQDEYNIDVYDESCKVLEGNDYKKLEERISKEKMRRQNNLNKNKF